MLQRVSSTIDNLNGRERRISFVLSLLSHLGNNYKRKRVCVLASVYLDSNSAHETCHQAHGMAVRASHTFGKAVFAP